MSIRQEIIDSCAWMLWANAWITLQEDPESEISDRVHPGPGGSWDPLVPAVPASMTAWAGRLIASIERQNGAPIEQLYARAIALPGKRYSEREPTPERFGNCRAYEMIGAGVSWGDDYPDHGLKLPRVEAIADSNTDAWVSAADL